MKAQVLAEIESFLLSDRVTLKGSEFLGFAAMVSQVQQEKAKAANAEMVAARTRPVAVPTASE